jgi:regulatory protein
MDLLARREYSRVELVRKLSRRFADRGAVDDALDRLEEEGLQSDGRFALSFSRERMLRGQGPRRIVSELRQRGIGSSQAEGALDQLVAESGATWEALAEGVLKKRYGSSDLVGLDPQERVRRLRFLHARGFDTEAFGPILD